MTMRKSSGDKLQFAFRAGLQKLQWRLAIESKVRREKFLVHKIAEKRGALKGRQRGGDAHDGSIS